MRTYMKHKSGAPVLAVEIDTETGEVIGALDVSDDDMKGVICPHGLDSMPLSEETDFCALVTSARRAGEYQGYTPDCRNAHHLMRDLMDLEKVYREALARYDSASRKAKALKEEMEEAREEVHGLLHKINNPQRLPLFDTSTAA